MLNVDVKNYIERSILCWLATASEDASPNVSPKEIFTYDGDTHLLIANIASPTSLKNIKQNSSVCVSFIDVFVQKGYKLTGVARVWQKKDTGFEQKAERLQQIAGPLFPVHSFLSIEVQDVAPIIAPRYRFYPETTEAQQIENALKQYGVRR